MGLTQWESQKLNKIQANSYLKLSSNHTQTVAQAWTREKKWENVLLMNNAPNNRSQPVQDTWPPGNNQPIDPT